MEGIFIIPVAVINKIHTANMLNGERTQALSSWEGNDGNISTTFIQHLTQDPSLGMQKEKEIRGIKIGKERENNYNLQGTCLCT
jgi:hypothetical protein